LKKESTTIGISSFTVRPTQALNPSLDVNGWVQRVALTPERERQINAATPDVWYDASANLARKPSRLATGCKVEE
jgi:hypothetical protein